MYPSKSKKSHAASVLPDQDVVAIGKLVYNIGVDARIEEPLGMQTTYWMAGYPHSKMH